MKDNTISEKKQKLIDAVNSAKLQVDDIVDVDYNTINGWEDKSRKNQTISCVILKIGKKISVRRRDNSAYKDVYSIVASDIKSRDTSKVGANPFSEQRDNTRTVAFALSSIISALDLYGENEREYDIAGTPIKRCNWNPFIHNKDGNKEHYQRPFVWTLQDKQMLVESIYQGIDCGKILIRKRGWEELKEMQANGETELAFNDIVDGKQRLEAIRGFIMLEYKDANGNLFSDLSDISQRKFEDHQLFSYAEMPENTKDEDVIHQFLKMNFCGVLQSE